MFIAHITFYRDTQKKKKNLAKIVISITFEILKRFGRNLDSVLFLPVCLLNSLTKHVALIVFLQVCRETKYIQKFS